MCDRAATHHANIVLFYVSTCVLYGYHYSILRKFARALFGGGRLRGGGRARELLLRLLAELRPGPGQPGLSRNLENYENARLLGLA